MLPRALAITQRDWKEEITSRKKQLTLSKPTFNNSRVFEISSAWFLQQQKRLYKKSRSNKEFRQKRNEATH